MLWNINAYHLRYCFEVPETTPPDSQSIQQWIHDSQALEESVSQVDAGMQCLLEPAIPEITIGQAPVDSPSAVTPSKGHAAMDGSFALCPSAASAMGSPPAVKRKNSTVADIVAAPKPSKKAGLLARLVGGTAGIMPPPVSPLIVTPPPAGPHVPAASPPPVSVKRKLLFTDRDQPRKQRQWCREKTAVGQSIAQEAGLDFNKHFQVQHKGHLEKGHWQDFLLGLAGVQVSPCPHCQTLVKAFKLVSPAHPEQMASPEQQASSEPVGPGQGSQRRDCPMSDSNCIVMVDDSPSPEHKRARRGRPNLCEARLNLCEWVEQHRPGQYRILSLDGRVPVQCIACGFVFNAHKTTSAWHVLRHESESKFHLSRTVPAVKGQEPLANFTPTPCNGVEISKNGRLQSLTASVVKYIMSGQIHQFGTPLEKVSFFLDKNRAPWMQCKQCASQSQTISPGQSSCQSCQKYASMKDMSKHIATTSWKIDAWLHDVA